MGKTKTRWPIKHWQAAAGGERERERDVIPIINQWWIANIGASSSLYSHSCEDIDESKDNTCSRSCHFTSSLVCEMSAERQKRRPVFLILRLSTRFFSVICLFPSRSLVLTFIVSLSACCCWCISRQCIRHPSSVFFSFPLSHSFIIVFISVRRQIRAYRWHDLSRETNLSTSGPGWLSGSVFE